MEVKSHLPDAVEGDYFLGNTTIIVIIITSISTSFRLGYVKSVNSKNANVVISFDQHDDDGQSSDLVIVILILTP